MVSTVSNLASCPFCAISSDQVLFESDAAIALCDPRAAVDGVLVAPRRHISTMDELSSQEHDEVWRLVAEVHKRWDARSDLDGSTVIRMPRMQAPSDNR